MTTLMMGIDIGTTRIKAGLVADGRDVIHVESVNTPWRTTKEGPVVDVAQIGDLALTVAAKCADHATSIGAHVAGIGTTGMAETGALLDARREPLAPGFAWHHTLGDAAYVQESLGETNFAATTGHGCDLAPSIVKLDYLRSGGHQFVRGQRWLNIPEYVTWRLTGEEACELSLSGRTGLFDLTGKRWWDEAFDFLGAGSWLMPGEPQPAGHKVGEVSDAIPSLRGAVVTTAGHDHPVGALSIGALNTGLLCYSLGTSEAQVRIVAPTLSRDDVLALVQAGVTVDWHPVGDRWYVLGTVPTGLTLERLSTLLGCASTEERLKLSREAMEAAPPPGARLRDVTLDSFSLVGVTTGDTPASVWRAAVEHLLDNSGNLRDAVSAVIGAPGKEIVFGGWIHDPLVARQRGSRGQHPIDNTPLEPGIVGASLAAACASGHIASLEEAVSHP